MGNFVGIDLGTTNSVIYTYDGANTRIWKSREQNDVTPSAIYIDRRNNRHVGQRAYNQVVITPDNCATEFKRKMGTSTPIDLPAVNQTLTAVECSAEILKTLFGYLPDEIRQSPDTGTIVTVPAAFGQMKTDATSQAAALAELGNVALMQEPVAAAMSYMRGRNTDGRFLIYDLGGGTFDAAIAESTGGRVSLLAHGGIEFCGGRDFDRLLRDEFVLPHLRQEYRLPEDLSGNPGFKPLLRVIERAAEIAKIDLSSMEEAMILIDDPENPLEDLNGEEIFSEIPLRRDDYNALIAGKINDTINRADKTMEECGVSSRDLDCIVWVGGPTNYGPLREKVASELGIEGELPGNLNPMTAVAEGASIFAESIDWGSEGHTPIPDVDKKRFKGFSFNSTSRTPTTKSKIVAQVDGNIPVGAAFEVACQETRWISGKIPLTHGATAEVNLTKPGENMFEIVVYDGVGEPIEQQEIVITKTAATVDAIPASHTIALEVLDKFSRRQDRRILIEKNDPLPKQGSLELIADETVEAGSADSLKFTLLEGAIEKPNHDCDDIGCFKVSGSDFEAGTIPKGADLTFTYEVLDSGEVEAEVEIPTIGKTFFHVYSSEEGKIDYSSADTATSVADKAAQTRNRIDEIAESVNDPQLQEARQKLEGALSLNSNESESEKVQDASERVKEAKELVSEVENRNRKVIRKMDLDGVVNYFDRHCRRSAQASEADAFDNLAATAQRSIENDENNFDDLLDELKVRNFATLWRQPWFVIDYFIQLVRTPESYKDPQRFEALSQKGMQIIDSDAELFAFVRRPPQERVDEPFLESQAIEELRDVIRELRDLRYSQSDPGIMANILLKG